MDTLTIMLVEDDPVTVQAFVQYADTLEDIEIVCTCSSAAEAIAAISDYLPHAVILDLELQHGAGSGLDVLHGIKNAQLSIKPFILITQSIQAKLFMLRLVSLVLTIFYTNGKAAIQRSTQ